MIEILLPALIILIPTIIGLLILYKDLESRRTIMKDEHTFQNKKYEEEKEFKNKNYEEEKVLRDEQKEWLKSETLKLTQVAEPLAAHIKNELTRNLFWLVESMQQAKLGTESETLFRERMGHFNNEKRVISEEFVPLLLQRCEKHVESGKSVCLIIDSGTTLYNFFEKLSHETVRLFHAKEKWLDNLMVATNNLPGLQVLMDNGRMNPRDRFSQLAIQKCQIFPGKPLPIYGAITGEVTNEAVVQLREEQKNTIFIGITVGNWIRIRRSHPVCPIPMARGEGHYDFKLALVNNSDEVYVITPLGKIFMNLPPSRSNTDEGESINDALGLSPNNPNPEKEIYKELTISGESAKKIKLVSTYRVFKRRLLYEHSSKLQTILNINPTIINIDNPEFPTAQIEEIQHIMFPFDGLPDNQHFESETEFPHKITRKPEFMRKYFSVRI